MFRIGEFAQIAQVSGRQLRHYDQLGLLRPVRVDPQTGYRYYSASQLRRLNQILALKDLGVTLEQIGPMLDGKVSTAEIRGMLAMRRAQVEQTLKAEEVRLRQIEARIAQIDAEGAFTDYDIVVKAVEAQPFLAARCTCADMDEAVRMVEFVAREARPRLRGGLCDRLIVVSRPDFHGDALDLDIGFSLTRPSNITLSLSGGLPMTMQELPAIATMAALVRSGPPEQSHAELGALGRWIEAKGCEICGPCREVFLQEGAEPTMEIQFPIRDAA